MEVKLFTLLLVQFVVTANGNANIENAVRQINRKCKTELNVFINLNSYPADGNISQEFEEQTSVISHLPKIIKTAQKSLVTPVQQFTTEQVLIVAWVNWSSLKKTIAAIDKLLWQLHYKDILLIYHHPMQLDEELLLIFQSCWKNGFTSVLVMVDNQAFTYHPYPLIQVKMLTNISEFGDKSHLNNFHLYAWPQGAVDLPPRFSLNKNPNSQQKYSGYLYNMISLFLTHHNGTIDYYFIDLGATSVLQMAVLSARHGFTIGPFFAYYHQNLLASKALYLAKAVLIVPTAKEIPESLYLLIPLDILVYVVILFSGFLFFILLLLITLQDGSTVDWSENLLQAFNVIMFLSVTIPRRSTAMSFILSLLFLFTGIFLTNNYSSSLSSLYTSKVYEAELEHIDDIKRTNLRIYEYSLDMVAYDRLEYLPSIIRQRLHVANDTELFEYRKRLNMTFIYEAIEDMIDYYLSQQMYLKKPIARKLQESLFVRPLIVSLAHRSPLIEQFNRFLSLILETGIYNKFVKDAYWEGFLSEHLQIFLDPELTEALRIQYFQYAFVLLATGLTSAFISFLFENIWKRVVEKRKVLKRTKWDVEPAVD